jgi:hypothetical protein
VGGEFAVELADERDPIGKPQLRAGGVSAEFFAGVAPLTTKLAPGSVWKRAASVGSLTQSCAQATRARIVSAASGLSSKSRSKRAPNSLRVSLAVRAV